MKDQFIIAIGEKIRNLRQAANLTQWELADRADLTDGFISQVERG
ncbi:MAG: helix-turn-helix domain-containing protein, partial [bacterium]